jgi:universal bacterial protein YeaZ
MSNSYRATVFEGDYLLFIETSTLVCSVAVSKGESIFSERVVKEPKAHAKIIPHLIKEVLAESKIGIDDCRAICVSSGPGSYTGLRVGVSFAKGLCYGSDKPLISVGSLELLANYAIDTISSGQPTDEGQLTAEKSIEFSRDSYKYIIPMIDARRMEVYTAIFTNSAEQISPVEAHIIEQASFSKELERGGILFCGNGAQKASQIITHPNAHFLPLDSISSGMLRPALKKLMNEEFEDIAYFEPFYLKDFIAGVSTKKLF